MKVEALPGFGEVREAEWTALVERSGTRSVFLTWQWQTAWADAFAADGAVTVLKVTDDAGAFAGALPLYVDAPGQVRIVGGVDVSDYLDLIAARGQEREIWDALLHHRAGEPAVWDLHGIRAASPTVTLLPDLAEALGLTASLEREERCPVVGLPASWDEYLARLGSHDRHELRRKTRRLERELPGASVRSVTGPGDWDIAMTEFLTLHRRSKVGKARFMNEHMERFFRESTHALARAGWARLWFLDWNGSPVAAFLCLEYGTTVGLYNSGFDPAHARLAPGIVLLAHVIRDAIDRGVPTFDFLRGEEPYKYAFGATAEDLFNIRVSP